MVRLIFLLVFILLAGPAANGQNHGLAIGLELTPSRTTLWGSISENDNDPLYEPYPGINLEYTLRPRLFLRTGLAYERKGFKYEVLYSNLSGLVRGSYYNITSFEYVTLPVAIAVSTDGIARFYAHGGAFLAYMIRHRMVHTASEHYPEQTIDLTGLAKRWDAGLSLGAGLIRPLGRRFLVDIGFRNHLGLIHVLKQEETDDRSGIRTNSLGLFVSLKYRLL